MEILSPDPAVSQALRLSLALLFGVAGVAKLRDPARFRENLAAYRLLPRRWVGGAAPAIAGVELAITAALLVPALQAAGAVAAMAVLIAYAAAIGVNLLRGRRDIDCGCSGPALRQTLSSSLVARNLALAAVAWLGAQPPAPRALTVADALVIGAAVAVSAMLYTAANTLLASGQRLALADSHHD